MRFLAGWIAGLATAWVALAIWRRTPPEDRWQEAPDDEWPPPPTIEPDAFESVAGSYWFCGGARRPSRDSVAGGTGT